MFTKKSVNDEKKEKSPFEVLAYAISDIGLFTWYSAELPQFAQLEFNRTMLYFEPKDTESAPSNQIALQFGNIKSVHIFKETESQLPENWLDLLTDDKLEPFNVNYEFFSFNGDDIEKMVSSFGNHKKVFGDELEKLNETTDYKIGFKAGEIAIVLSAERMRIMTHSGEVKINSIPEIHTKWWGYWKRYWDLIDSDNKLPYDPLCEITIPAG